MDEHKPGPKDLSVGERLATLTGAKADALTHKLAGEHETMQGARSTVDPGDVEALIQQWPDAPQRVARQMLEQYGAPNEATPTKLFWYRNGPWKRTIMTSDVIVHNFPTAHSDFLTQVIDYPVPIDMVGELTRFDGSCLVDRTAGEVAARCDSEAANILTLNLMHDIVSGKTNVEEARQVYAEVTAAYAMGRPAPYAERLQFAVLKGGAEDPDEGMIAGAMVRQTVRKVADLATGNEERSSG